MDYKSVIFSGLPGAGKTTLIECLQKVYEWPVHGIGQFFRDEHKKLFPNDEVPFEQWWPSLSLDEQKRVNDVSSQIYAKGNVIGDSRYAQSYQGIGALLVFLTADVDVRAERNTAKHSGKSVDEVKALLLKREADEVAVGMKLWGDDYDYRDPKHYHLVLNTGLLSVDEEFGLVRRLV